MTQKKDLAVWLFMLTAVIALVVIIGGLTRLTDSGLSITEWQPIAGIIPPLSETAWQEAFLKYQQIPEYRFVNRGMELSAFKVIYWWEWAHRALGRILGFIFLIPFLIFLARGRIDRHDVAPLLALFILGAAQGALGWYMVQSGLSVRVDVSHYRLAAHLMLALVIFTASLWLALGYWYGRSKNRASYLWQVNFIFVLILGQAFLGALVAGLDAGTVYTDFPTMAGAWLPEGLFAPQNGEILADPLSVQFLHRLTAYILVAFAVWHVWRTRSGRVLLAAILVQVALGIATLLTASSLFLAVAHQLGGLVVLGLGVVHLYDSRYFPN